MVKAKTSVVQKKSTKNTPVKPLKKGVKVTHHDPIKELLNETLIRDAIWEYLQKDDSAGVMEVLAAYIEALEMDAARRDAALPRSTFYHSLKAKNPTLKTLAKLVSVAHARPD